ncbi:hypothetical protein SORBI_3008G180701 [Sorghum bicolor]|uniref:Uncharacterized protein n=1 Tax=Sorghum bicolor TaxID=4558 RepID=A0A1Z5R7E4_SORBI|nr:hypothetical protein SORBI_3008G180701 [Sorghum bicolor]
MTHLRHEEVQWRRVEWEGRTRGPRHAATSYALMATLGHAWLGARTRLQASPLQDPALVADLAWRCPLPIPERWI